MKQYFIFFTLVVLFLSACCETNTEDTQENSIQPETEIAAPETSAFYATPLTGDSAAVIASQITYDVVVKNPNPNDEWTEQCLQNLNKDALVKIVFDAVYSGKVTAINYKDDTEMTIQQVKEMEKNAEYKRDKIAKVQFIEEWYFDAEKFQFGKKVLGVMLAYERLNEDGSLSDNPYYAGIKVMFNN